MGAWTGLQGSGGRVQDGVGGVAVEVMGIWGTLCDGCLMMDGACMELSVARRTWHIFRYRDTTWTLVLDKGAMFEDL